MNAEKLEDALHFDNRFTHELPANPVEDNYVREVEAACYSRVQPAKVTQPRLVAYSREIANRLDLSNALCQTQDFADVFAGNGSARRMLWRAPVRQLGDGRAINLGEVVNGQGERWVLQLKGAGSPANVLAGLRSSVRDMFYDGRPKAEPGTALLHLLLALDRFNSLRRGANRTCYSNLSTTRSERIFPTRALRPKKRICAGTKRSYSAPPC